MFGEEKVRFKFDLEVDDSWETAVDGFGWTGLAGTEVRGVGVASVGIWTPVVIVGLLLIDDDDDDDDIEGIKDGRMLEDVSLGGL